MYKHIMRVTCDRCATQRDYESEDDAVEAGWTNLSLNGSLANSVTLCPACIKVKEMVNDAFMRNDPFGLRYEASTREGHWYISN